MKNTGKKSGTNAVPVRDRLWRTFHQLGSPPYRLPARGANRSLAGSDLLRAARGGRVLGAGAGAARLSAGRQLQDHLHPRAQRLPEHGRLCAHGRRGGHRLHLAHEAGPWRGGERGPAGRLVHRPGADNRRHLGQAHVGHLLGMGRCAADVRTAPVVPVYRLHGPADVLRRTRQGGPGQRAARGCGRGERAHRPLLGGVVDDAAPGPDADP